MGLRNISYRGLVLIRWLLKLTFVALGAYDGLS